MKKAKSNVKAVIREAMKKVKKNRKLKIVNQAWGCFIDPKKGYFVADENKEVCALGALLVHKNGSIKFDEFRGKRPLDALEQDEVAAYVLGVDTTWVRNFIRGFDYPTGDSPFGKSKNAAQKEAVRAHRIGQELAKEFKLVVEDDTNWCDCYLCKTCA